VKAAVILIHMDFLFTWARIGSVKRENLNGNFHSGIRFFLERCGGIDCDAEFEMEIDIENDEFDADKFRDYAAECRRLARAASEKDRTVLIEIADAWIACAEQAERKAGCHRKQ
jgi:hypothetical protein